MTIEKWWQMHVRPSGEYDQQEADTVLCKAGIAGASEHATEDEAKAAAEEALCKIKTVTDDSWTAYYVWPQMLEERPNWNETPSTRTIRSEDVRC